MSKKIYCKDCKQYIGSLEKGSKTMKGISYRCPSCEKLTVTMASKPKTTPFKDANDGLDLLKDIFNMN